MLTRRLMLFLLPCLGLCGCGSNEPYPVEVRGTVTLDDKPLDDGVISFITLGQVPESIEIKKGVFQGKVKWGQRRVEFAAYRPFQIPASIPESMHALMKDGKENYLPEQYHVKSEITVLVNQRGVNEFPFALKSN